MNKSDKIDYRVIFAATSGRVSGVDVFSFNLARALTRSGLSAEIVRTTPYGNAPDPLPFPPDIATNDLDVFRKESLHSRWKKMIEYLEARAPCIYVPNYDWDHSCVSPVLPDTVGIVGIVHSDDPVHYEHVHRLGKYWNKIVAVSPTIARKLIDRDAQLASRTTVIPYGIDVPDEIPDKHAANASELRIVYAGRLIQEQKRVFDIAKIADALVDRKIPFRLTIAGGGADQKEFLKVCTTHMEQGRLEFRGILMNHDVLAMFEGSDVFILPSEFEGLPVSLLEAMGRGCVPVVTDIESGIPEIIKDGINGFAVPVGDIQAFADRLEGLQRDPTQRAQLARNAHGTVLHGGYTVDDMARSYVETFEDLWKQRRSGGYVRPAGRILPPRNLLLRSYVPAPIRAALNFMLHSLKTLLRKATALTDRGDP